MGRVFRRVLATSAFLLAVAAGGRIPLVAERLTPLPYLPDEVTPASSLQERAIVGWTYQGCYRYVFP
jgi:hypothetical protein